MYGESTMETYVTICEMESQWGLLYDRELKPGLCDDLEGWGREAHNEGAYAYPWLAPVNVWQFTVI